MSPEEVRALTRALKQQLEGLKMWGLKEVPALPPDRSPRSKVEPHGPCTVLVQGGHARGIFLNAPPSTVLGIPRPGSRGPELRDGAEPRTDPACGGTGARAAALSELEHAVIACTRCSLYRTRTHHVFGDGDPEAKLVFVGEAPGREEDLQGKPFVGAAGQLLTKMIEAIGLRRDEVYICNVLKDRPPGNRTPEPEEVEACFPFLEQQLAIIQPKVICVLGAIAAKALLGPHIAITKARGHVHDYRGIPLVPTFHPAYLLRNPAAKTFAWADLKRVKALLESET